MNVDMYYWTCNSAFANKLAAQLKAQRKLNNVLYINTDIK